MHEAVKHAAGKPGSDLTAIYCWHFGTKYSERMVERHRHQVGRGSRGSTFVMQLQGDPKKWDRLTELKRVNPLMWGFANSRDVLTRRIAGLPFETADLKASLSSRTE